MYVKERVCPASFNTQGKKKFVLLLSITYWYGGVEVVLPFGMTNIKQYSDRSEDERQTRLL